MQLGSTLFGGPSICLRVVEAGPDSSSRQTLVETHQYLDPAEGTICGGGFVSEHVYIGDLSATLCPVGHISDTSLMEKLQVAGLTDR